MQYTAAGRSDNALQKVVFIVQYTNEFTEEVFAAIDVESKNWRKELPRRSVSNAVLLQSAPSRVSFEEEKVVGLAYEALMKDGKIEFGLRFDDDRILFLAGKYTQWDEIWPRAEEHLKSAMKLIPDSNPVSSYSVEYTDLFRGIGNYTDFHPSGLLREGSKYTPKYIFEQTENFHFHSGYFKCVADPGEHRVLTRINADLRDNDDEKSRDLSIVLFHQFMPQRTAWVGETELPDDVLKRGLENFAILHSLDKQILHEIINDEMSNSIGLLK